MVTVVPLTSLSPDQARIARMAARAARRNGDPEPDSVSWVYASRGAIVDAMQFGIPDDERQREQILVQIIGRFKPNHRHRRGFVLPTSAAALAFGIDHQTWSTPDSSIGDLVIDLESLGPVYQITGPLPG